MHRYILASAAYATIIALGASHSFAADPLNIKLAWSTIPGHFAPFIPTTPKYAPALYRHYGKSYVVEPVKLRGGGANLTALAAGEIDLDNATRLRSFWARQKPSLISASSLSRSRPRCRDISTHTSGCARRMYPRSKTSKEKLLRYLAGAAIPMPPRKR